MANLETEPEGSQDTDEVEITNLDYPVMPARRPQPTPRQRRLSLLLTSVLFVLVVGSLLANTAEVRGLVTRTFFQSSTNSCPFLPVADASEKNVAQQLLAALPATPSQ
jgi:hypothetical protein